MAGPPQLDIIVISESIEVFRILKADDPASPGFIDGFKSNAALGRPRRPRSPEMASQAIYTGVSVFDTEARAIAMQQRYPDIGRFVARLVLPPGVRIAYWGSAGHASIWAEPHILADTVAAIVEIVDPD